MSFGVDCIFRIVPSYCRSLSLSFSRSLGCCLLCTLCISRSGANTLCWRRAQWANIYTVFYYCFRFIFLFFFFFAASCRTLFVVIVAICLVCVSFRVLCRFRVFFCCMNMRRSRCRRRRRQVQGCAFVALSAWTRRALNSRIIYKFVAYFFLFTANAMQKNKEQLVN